MLMYICMICMGWGLDQSKLLAARPLAYTQLDRASSIQQTDLSVNDLLSLPASSSHHLSTQGSQSQKLCTVYIFMYTSTSTCHMYVCIIRFLPALQFTYVPEYVLRMYLSAAGISIVVVVRCSPYRYIGTVHTNINGDILCALL